MSSPVVGSGTVFAPAPSFAWYCHAPAGLLTSSHSYPNRVSKKVLSHVVGVGVQVTSSPLTIASAPLPLPYLLF